MSKTLVSRPSNGAWNREISPDNAPVREVEKPVAPLRSRQREGISDSARWRAEAYAEQSNSRNWQTRTENNRDNGVVDIKRAEARLQVLNWLEGKKQSVIKR